MPRPAARKAINRDLRVSAEGVTAARYISRLYVARRSRATLALRRQTQPLTATFHATCTNGPARSENIPWASAHSHVFPAHPLTPPTPLPFNLPGLAALAPAWRSLRRHRKAKLRVSFSYRGKPRHRLPLFAFAVVFVFVICPAEEERKKNSGEGFLYKLHSENLNSTTQHSSVAVLLICLGARPLFKGLWGIFTHMCFGLGLHWLWIFWSRLIKT